MVDNRCPGGVRLRAYERCQRETFAWAGLYARWDGLVERITTYNVRPRNRACLPELRPNVTASCLTIGIC